MSRKQEKDFEELELYLQEAQKELLSSFDAGTKQENKKSTDTENTEESVCNVKRDSLSDILDLYDNVEFYKEDEKKYGEFGIKDCKKTKKIKANFLDDKNNNICANKTENIVNNDCLPHSSLTCPTVERHTEFDRASASFASDTLEPKNSQEISDVDSNLTVSLTCEDVKSRSQGSQVVKKTGHRNHTDDLSDCKSWNGSVSRSVMNGGISTRPTNRKPATKPCQEVSDHSGLAGNHQLSGSQIEVTPGNTSSFSVNDMQIDGKQPSYLTGDNSQLDNRKSDREIEGGTLMRLQPRDVSILKTDGYSGNKLDIQSDSCIGNYGKSGTKSNKDENKVTGLHQNIVVGSKSTGDFTDSYMKNSGSENNESGKNLANGNGNLVKDDLEEFLEEINESIDVLISEGKSDMNDSCMSSNSRSEISDSGVLCTGKSDSSDSVVCGRTVMSDSGVSFLSKSDISESCISYTSSDSGYSYSQYVQSHSDQGTEKMDNSNEGSEVTVGNKTNDRNSYIDVIKSERSKRLSSGDNAGEVIETDAGFYWLTCSIEEGKSAVNTEWNGTICSVDEEKSDTCLLNTNGNHVKDDLEGAIKGKPVVGNNSVDKCSLNSDFDKLESHETDKGDKPSEIATVFENSMKENSQDQTGGAKSTECKAENKSKTTTEGKDNADQLCNKNNNPDGEHGTGLERNLQNVRNLLRLPWMSSDIMTTSSPAVLSPSSGQDNIAKDDNIIGTKEDMENVLLKRKYSCPPGMFRIFKVVSVDIPKIDTSRKSGSHENIKRSSWKDPEKRHSNVKKDRKEPKRHSLEAFLLKQREEPEASEQVKGRLDKTGSKVTIEPPDMFKDKPENDVDTGPILKPPPDFDTDGQTVVMDTQHLPPPVWDPGVGTTGLEESREGDKQSQLPSTPPPPPVDHTEKLISKTLNQQMHRKHSVDASTRMNFLKPPDTVRRKSADSGIKNENVEVNSTQNSALENSGMVVDHQVGKIFSRKFETENHRHFRQQDLESDVSELLPNILSGNVKIVNNSDYQEVLPKNDPSSEQSALELAKMLDLIESYHNEESIESETEKENSALPKWEKLCHKQEFPYAETNTLDSLDRRKTHKKDQLNDTCNGKENEEDPSAIYATVDKIRPRLPTPEKVVPDTNSQEPPPIPPKPKYLSERFQSKTSLSDIETEPSPDFQVMFNSLSPVLLRRSNSSRSHRKNGSSTESSPGSTPDVSPRGAQKVQDNFRENQGITGKNGQSSSIFMDPEMAKTWHGTTSTDWSQYYGPQMRAMMEKLNQVQNGIKMSNQDSISKSSESLDQTKSKTLPSKSLLDEMHKKFCADQYMNGKDIEMTRALVLFRLKSQQPPTKARRSQSFNIRMGTGASYTRLGLNHSHSSASSKTSPKFPRSAERLRIKTRPDVQYSPKSGRIRGVNPEPLKLEDLNIEAQNSQKEEAEIEAIEACRWLRETGFPQYAQLYEDGQFPLEIESVEKDHDFLDKEDIQSLFRRLNTLNKCAIMKIATPTKKECEESDEEDICALSDKWKYQRTSRRWSRKDLDCPVVENRNGQPALKSASSHDSLLADQNSSSETGDSPVLDSKMLHTDEDAVFKTSTPLYDANGNATTGVSPKVIRRAASERIKGAKSFLKRMESLKGKRTRKNKTITEISGPVIADNAGMQAKIKHLNCRDISMTVDANSNIPETNELLMNEESDVKVNVAISSPELVTSPRKEALTVVTPPRRLDNSSALNVTNASALSSVTGNISTENSADLSQFSTNGALGLDMSVKSRHSNSSEATNSSEETFFIPGEHRPGKFPTRLDVSLFASDSSVRTRSYSYADENCEKDTRNTRRGSHDPRKQMNRVSIYDNVPIEEDLATAQQELDIILSELFQNINGLNKAINGENAEPFEPPVSESFLDDISVSIDSQNLEIEQNLEGTGIVTAHDENEILSATLSSPDISDHETQTEDMSHDDSAEHIVVRERRDSGVGSSLTRTNSERRKYRIRWHSFQKSHRPSSESRNLQLYNLSAGQILRLRKLSLLKLTALIEKYAPNRSGWSLTVPRFMKRNKVPDYKDKNVFGVPFYVMIQRTGQALPQCILHAMRFLRRTSGDALGIFRKSGVRSRIQKLRNDIEADPEAVDFEDLQAYDVADLVKQYFRELPECLLTNKLSDIFISIFIYVPTEVRLEALQAAVVLMTDENRDVLQSLLLFLSDIAKHANKHQMTASNLAVCFAPSLFNMGTPRNMSQTPSPRRNRKNPGIPDARELMEQKAAHECLTVMINECKKLFTIPAIVLSKCRVFDEDPVTLEDLNKQSEDGSQGYSAHIESCIQGLIKESREKFRGWVSVPSPNDVDVSYKKVCDGHPLRLWKCAVDVEAPPNEVLNRVLNDRQKWDEDLLQWNTVEKLDEQTEVFQYVRNSMAPHPTRDYCVLRSWRTNLPKGACVLISTSIDHKNADLLGGIRAVELASRYLIEPCGTGKSRLTHISRVDLRGHSPEWYKKVYGHICANFMDHIRASFQCNSEGPETKV